MNYIVHDPQRLEEYRKWLLSRRPKALSDLPTEALNKILPAAQELLNLGHTEAELTGSYARGDYLTTTCPDYFWELKLEIHGKAKLPDVDVIVYKEPLPSLSDALSAQTNLFDKHTIPLLRDGKIML